MKIEAGGALNQRKPRPAPIMAPHRTASSPVPGDEMELQIVREYRVADDIREDAEVSAAIITGTMASPSRPSVRFTALPAPTMMKLPNMTKNQPSDRTSSLKKGNVSERGERLAPERMTRK